VLAFKRRIGGAPPIPTYKATLFAIAGAAPENTGSILFLLLNA
jgi:hypothetical protein